MSNDELSNFYDAMLEAGEKADSSSGNLGMVGKVLVQFGFHFYNKGGQPEDFWYFWIETKTPAEMDTKAAEINAKVKEAGYTNNARFGIRVTVFKDVLTQEKPYKKDVSEFTAKWQKQGFDLLYSTLKANGIPTGETFYGQVQSRANPYHVTLGDNGKTETDSRTGEKRFPSIRVPVKKFKDEKEARAFVNSSTGPAHPPFSELALKTFEGNIESFISEADVIQKYLTMALQGIGVDNQPLAEKPNPPQAKQYIADTWKVEPGDIDLVLQLLQEPAF